MSMTPRSVDVPAVEILTPPIKSDNDKKEYRQVTGFVFKSVLTVTCVQNHQVTERSHRFTHLGSNAWTLGKRGSRGQRYVQFSTSKVAY
jgi:hypothetical protein